MSFGRPSWIAEHLLAEESLMQVRSVDSKTVTYGSTTGPWRGIGGAALSTFQMTLVTTYGEYLLFADQTLFGWAPYTDEEDVLSVWSNLPGNDGMAVFRSPNTCPIEVKDPRA